jgi:hypothetical protein
MKTQHPKNIANLQPGAQTGNNVDAVNNKSLLARVYRFFASASFNPCNVNQFIF